MTLRHLARGLIRALLFVPRVLVRDHVNLWRHATRREDM